MTPLELVEVLDDELLPTTVAPKIFDSEVMVIFVSRQASVTLCRWRMR